MKHPAVTTIESVLNAVEQEHRQVGKSGEWRITGSELANLRVAAHELIDYAENLRVMIEAQATEPGRVVEILANAVRELALVMAPTEESMLERMRRLYYKGPRQPIHELDGGDAPG